MEASSLPSQLPAQAQPLDASSVKPAPSPLTQAQPETAQPAAPAENAISVRLLFPSRFVGALIGRQGVNISRCRQESGATINISPVVRGTTERVISIQGGYDSAIKAIQMIAYVAQEAPAPEAKADGGAAEAQQQLFNAIPKCSVTLLVPNDQVGCIIGKAGAQKKAIQDSTGVIINISTEPLAQSTDRSVSLSGTFECVTRACVEIVSLLVKNPASGSSGVPIHYVPMPTVPLLPTPAVFPPPFPAAAPAVSAPPYGTNFDGNILTQQIRIPNNLIGCVIGKQGATINAIRQASCASIKIGDRDATNHRVVTVMGPPHANEIALHMIHSKITQAMQQQTQQGPPSF